MSFEVDIRRQPLADNQIVVSAMVDGVCKEQWIVLDGPHIQSTYSQYVYVKVASTGRTERLYLDRHEADQVRALQKNA